MKRRYTDGFILYATLSLLILIGLVVSTALIISNLNVRSANDNVRVNQVQTLAEGGLDEAASKVWYGIWGTTPTSYYRVAEYKRLLTDKGWGVGYTETSQWVNLLGVGDYQYTIQRVPDSADQAVHFVMTAKGLQGKLPGGTVRTVKQDIFVGGGLYNGLDFAVLTNNANCVMCHASVQSTEALATGAAATATAPFRRAKFATLESLQTRPGKEDSVLAGTFYTRGKWVDDQGKAVTGSTGFQTTQADNAGNITSTTKQGFTASDCSTTTACPTNKNFYTGYPKQTGIGAAPYNGKWPDGELPDRFPLPVPDTNGDRIISDSEWSDAVLASTSLADPDNQPGSITGNMQKVASTGNVTSFGGTTSQTANTGNNGNLVLDGTLTTPIEVNGTVYVNGDVIIRGFVKGDGKIIARGNVYVVGDVKYACGTDNHECNSDDWKDTSNIPKFALSAVGNISMGDFETPRYGDWSNSTVLEAENIQAATLKSGANAGQSATNGGEKNTVPGMAWREATLFNRLELRKYIESGKTYVPRLYKFANNSKDLVFWNDATDEGADNYADGKYLRIDAACASDVSKCPQGTSSVKVGNSNPDAPQTVDVSAADIKTFLAAAAVYTVAPKTNWITRSNLKQMYLDSVENNASRSNGSFRFDGLLYSANATFALAKPNASNGCIRGRTGNGGCSKTNGGVEIRGSLMSADTGILAPGNGNPPTATPSFKVFHDNRLSKFVKLRDTQIAGLYRADWSLER
ncbi:polymer-forming cytoskeletal protein [Deinococcus sp.]|uniref:polymer-forming cytoskeletal protein n=1 Tax=Deinococcus sp. TaxID=47478 RepID=UPI0025EF8BB9|nr:polymer-forming cytoskeletal protein [Deinococcus sp.]